MPTAAAYVIFGAGLRRVTVTAAGIATLLEPVTASALGVLVFGERLGSAEAKETARILAIAKAQADATKLSAEAAAAQGRIALDQQIIAQLPQMLTAAAEGLQGANLTVLNGAEGLNGTVASLAGQGMAILRALSESLPGRATTDDGSYEDPSYDEVEEGVVDEDLAPEDDENSVT